MVQRICDSEFPKCPTDARSGEFYKLRVKDLSPTQFAVGKAEVEVRAGRMRKKYKKDPDKLHDYLRVRPVPIVVRGERFYLVDHRVLGSITHVFRVNPPGKRPSDLHLCPGIPALTLSAGRSRPSAAGIRRPFSLHNSAGPTHRPQSTLPRPVGPAAWPCESMNACLRPVGSIRRAVHVAPATARPHDPTPLVPDAIESYP